MFSALPLKPDIAEYGRHVRFVAANNGHSEVDFRAASTVLRSRIIFQKQNCATELRSRTFFLRSSDAARTSKVISLVATVVSLAI